MGMTKATQKMRQATSFTQVAPEHLLVNLPNDFKKGFCMLNHNVH